VRVHHIALRCNDLQRAEVFWTGVFGLAVLRRDGDRAVWLDLDGAALMLERASPEEPMPAPGTLDFLALTVTPEAREAFERRCAARGVAVEHATAHTRYVRDPDGRRVGVSTYPLPTLSAP
jgi:catechol 2,3-dioxygenase-like lactoylglutathione lyase family enzyme